MKAYVINLPNRPDKLAQFRDNKFPFDVERFDGIVDVPGDNGCAKSHMAVISQIKEFPCVVFEDDCVMLEDWNTVLQSMAQLPEKWDALWLGATLTQKLERTHYNLARIKRAHTLHAVIYNSQRLIDYVLENFKVIEGQKSIIDLFYFEVQEKFNCYITVPICATQRAGFSDISQKDVDYYDYIVNSYWKNIL